MLSQSFIKLYYSIINSVIDTILKSIYLNIFACFVKEKVPPLPLRFHFQVRRDLVEK